MTTKRRASSGAKAQEDSVGLYMAELGRYPLLTKQDEVDLARTIAAGRCAELELQDGREPATRERRQLSKLVRAGESATQRFVQANLRLVVSIAKRYQGSGQPLLDLIQDGNLGLMHTVKKFDGSKGSSFRPTPPGGSAKPSPGESPTPVGPSACPLRQATPWPVSPRPAAASKAIPFAARRSPSWPPRPGCRPAG